MPLPVHLTEADYQKLFPTGVDEFPSVVNEQHYIDAWLLNTAFASLEEIETYLLTYQENIEALIGDDIIGDDGNPIINIPAARYPSYKTAMAWDSNLLEENIKSGEIIFGITGTYAETGTPVSTLGEVTPDHILTNTITIGLSHALT